MSLYNNRYSDWPIVEQSRDGSSGLVKRIHKGFITYSIANELLQMADLNLLSIRQQLLSNWGVRHRLQSVALAHSNGRAEFGVKTCRRMIMENTGPDSEVNIDKV